MRTGRSRPLPTMWRGLVFAVVIHLLALPALADDNAEANRLMVEAVGLIGAAEREPSAEERFRLLLRAHELLLDIVERLPSTDLAVKLATGQRIGTVSLAEVREAMDEARGAGAVARLAGRPEGFATDGPTRPGDLGGHDRISTSEISRSSASGDRIVVSAVTTPSKRKGNASPSLLRRADIPRPGSGSATPRSSVTARSGTRPPVRLPRHARRHRHSQADGSSAACVPAT